MRLAPGIAEALADIVGREYVRLAPHECALYAGNAMGFFRTAPDAVVFPSTTTEVAEIMRGANSCGIPVVQRAANAGGRPMPVLHSGGIALAVDRMNKVIEIRPEECLVQIQPQVTAAQLAEAATAVGLFYDPRGGDVTGSAHELSLDCLVAIETVSPAGDIICTGRGGTLDDGCVDLGRLLMSPGGAIITAVTLNLKPQPAVQCGGLAYFASVSDACRAVRSILASGRLPAVFEFLDRATIEALNDGSQLGLRQDAGALLLYVDDSDPLAIENIRRIGHMCLAVGALELTGTDQCHALLTAASRLCASTITRHGSTSENPIPLARRIACTLGVPASP